MIEWQQTMQLRWGRREVMPNAQKAYEHVIEVLQQAWTFTANGHTEVEWRDVPTEDE